MGRLWYGPTLKMEIGDRSLYHLDALLTELRGRPFQLHVVGLGGAADGNMLSLMVSQGVSLSLEFYNGPGMDFDIATIHAAMQQVSEGRSVTIPFDFDGVVSEGTE